MNDGLNVEVTLISSAFLIIHVPCVRLVILAEILFTKLTKSPNLPNSIQCLPALNKKKITMLKNYF